MQLKYILCVCKEMWETNISDYDATNVKLYDVNRTPNIFFLKEMEEKEVLLHVYIFYIKLRVQFELWT